MAWPSEASQIPTRKSCLRSAKLLSLTMIPIYHGDHITKSPTFIFFAFSLLRTKRLIPVHQCTMHTGSFAHLFFQNSEKVENFWWNLSFITFWLKNRRPNQQILISWAFSHIWSLKTSSGDGTMAEWKKFWAEILVCHGT